MSEELKVVADDWEKHVLGRFKHLYDRSHYCDLTLQFQNNQLKVHRLMLRSCTEYFENLERTRETYKDCLVMPDDLQADVVAPIINFMYTGHMVFPRELLEKLHACSQIMNLPVLTKLLNRHRLDTKSIKTYSKKARLQNIQTKRTQVHQSKFPPTPSLEVVEPPILTSTKRSYANAFETTTVGMQDNKHQYASNKTSGMNVTTSGLMYSAPFPVPLEVLGQFKRHKSVPSEPRPTRYELPEELDSDNLFENSFTNITYTSQPLMIHPERTKQHTKPPTQGLPSTSKKSRTNTMDIVECKRVTKVSEDSSFGETSSSMIFDELEMFRNIEHVNVETESNEDPNQLIIQLLDEEEKSTKVTTEASKNSKTANSEHAKIIYNILKQYPDLIKKNKNIEFQSINNPTPSKVAVKKQKACHQQVQPVIENTNVGAISDVTYETEVIDSQQAARLIALGVENTLGPWICLICGTPGRALHFTSYYIFRRHLVEVHKEKPVQNICEYCGQRMSKLNHLLHHLYVKHGVEPPPSHYFPKCQKCNYIALNQPFLVKHKLTHVENKSFRCNVCASMFNSSKMLLNHIQSTGHKCIADRKPNNPCMYCMKEFIRENNLFVHLKTQHKVDAVKDGVIDASDDESEAIEILYKPVVNEVVDNLEYHIQQTSNGEIQLIPKKSLTKQTILNIGLNPAPKVVAAKSKAAKAIHYIPTKTENKSFGHGNEDVVMIDNDENISLSGNRLIVRNAARQLPNELILSGMDPEKSVSSPQSIIPPTPVNYAAMISTNENIQQTNISIKNSGNLAEAIPIYVSNEDEYKALMAANHNIIFDVADKNKTMTVLTTSEAATLNSTGIDLDNAQNNYMMIIQDNYPLNTSEKAVVTNNSNIKVLYSQHVDDNKGFPQYASGVLKHNYETVGRASTVSRAQILDPPVTKWQGESPNNINILNSGAVQESNNDINDLPEVQLETVIGQPAVISQIEETHNETPSEHLQPESEMIQSSTIIQIQVDEPVVATIENEIDSVESYCKNRDHQSEHLNETETQENYQISEYENRCEVTTEILRTNNSSSDIQSEGVQEKNLHESNNDINDLPVVQLETVISQSIGTHYDTLSENLQPESEMIQSSQVIQMQVDEPVATIDNEIDNVKSNPENEDHQTEHINETACVTVSKYQITEHENTSELETEIKTMNNSNAIQPEGDQEKNSGKSNNDEKNLPEVQLKTVTNQPVVISQIEETHNDTPENLQPESEMIQSPQIIQMQVDEPVVATIENEIDSVESYCKNRDHQSEHLNETKTQENYQISEYENRCEVTTEILRTNDSSSDIQSEGVQDKNSHESNNDINDLPVVQLETVISQSEETHYDTLSENLQPESEMIQSSQVIQMQVDEPVATIDNELDNVKSYSENEDHQTEHINETACVTVSKYQITEHENTSELETEIKTMNNSNAIQPEGDQEKYSEKSNNDEKNLPEVQLKTVTNQPVVISQIEETHNDTPENLQPESEMIQSPQIIQMQVDEPIGATIENEIDSVESYCKNGDHQSEHLNETETQENYQISEYENRCEVTTEILRTNNSSSDIQSEGVQEKNLHESNNDINDLPVVQLETVISQSIGTHYDTLSENLQPESEMIQSSQVIQMQVDEPVATIDNEIDNVKSNPENEDHQTEHINETACVTVSKYQITEHENTSELETEIKTMNNSNAIQPEGDQEKNSVKSNNDEKNLPEVQLKTVTNQPVVISQIEETHNDTPENLQPESEMIQSPQIIQMQVDEPVVATIENEIDSVESYCKNRDHQSEHLNETKTQENYQISEYENRCEVTTEILRTSDSSSDIQSEGVQDKNSHESNNDINDLPVVQLETVISQSEETHYDTLSENLQPESEMIQSSQVIQMQVDEPVATIDNELDNVKSYSENEDHQTEHINETACVTVSKYQITEHENTSELETEIKTMNNSNAIQPEGDQEKYSEKSNNDEKNLPEVQLKTVTNQPVVISQIEETHNDTPENLQPESEMIQSPQIIQMQVDEPIGATIENEIDSVESYCKNGDHQSEHLNETETQENYQISEYENRCEVTTEILRTNDSSSDIQSEGVQEKNSHESNNDINDLPVVQLETVISQSEETHYDTLSENLQPESEMIQSSQVIQMQVDEPVATIDNELDNVKSYSENEDHQTEHINETAYVTVSKYQLTEHENTSELETEIKTMNNSNAIQPEGDQEKYSEKSNNDEKNLPEVQLKTVTNQPVVISQIEETHNDTPENLQPESEIIQSPQIIQMQVDEPVGATIENKIDNVESNSINVVHQTKNVNEIETPVKDQISESSDEDETETLSMDDPNSDSNTSHRSVTDENDQNEEDETLAESEDSLLDIPPIPSESGPREILNPVNISSLLNDWDDSQEERYQIDKSEPTEINTERNVSVNTERYYGAWRSP